MPSLSNTTRSASSLISSQQNSSTFFFGRFGAGATAAAAADPAMIGGEGEICGMCKCTPKPPPPPPPPPTHSDRIAVGLHLGRRRRRRRVRDRGDLDWWSFANCSLGLGLGFLEGDEEGGANDAMCFPRVRGGALSLSSLYTLSLRTAYAYVAGRWSLECLFGNNIIYLVTCKIKFVNNTQILKQKWMINYTISYKKIFVYFLLFEIVFNI